VSTTVPLSVPPVWATAGPDVTNSATAKAAVDAHLYHVLITLLLRSIVLPPIGVYSTDRCLRFHVSNATIP
jgi:hypothetical protein